MSLILLLQRCVQLYDKIIERGIYYTSDAILLLIRVYMASIFFQAGWNKLENALDDKWFKTVFLFKSIHPVPFLSPHTAAVLGTGAEIVFPILLAFGIMARISALGLLAVTAVITFVVHSHFTHIFWGLLLSVSFVMGPGRFALDGWLRAQWDQLCVALDPGLGINKISEELYNSDQQQDSQSTAVNSGRRKQKPPLKTIRP